MWSTKRRPLTVGQILKSEFLEPMNIEVGELADAMGVHRNTLSRIVHDKASLTPPMAMKLAKALGTTAEFWLNIQHAVTVWDLRHQAYAQDAENVRRIAANHDETRYAAQ
ncbi:HigA family addiction module antitoxin [Tepidiphilus margaritifer]|uniref:HigA family addiction module antitoxin n=1 Tax=Tepidiphilus margaritifer TaxID=203471 RepID=UPI0004129D09|nr:HigA family addiction module antitoxin [Tepidiphilus margaritifer]